jgi:hypothetical protein
VSREIIFFMQQLKTKFKKNGFNFSMLKRNGDVAIFEKTKPNFKQTFFEVIKIKTYPEIIFPNGIKVTAHECFPASESWGTCGWSFSDRERAFDHFNKLSCQTPKKRK